MLCEHENIFPKVRSMSCRRRTLAEKMCKLLVVFLIGIAVGLITKYMEASSVPGKLSTLFSAVGAISSGIGVWIFIATFIAVFSRTPLAAALHVLVFFVGMLLSYYAYSMRIFGFFPMYYFLRWGFIAMLAPFVAFFIWYGRGEGELAAMMAAVSPALLFERGYCFFYTFKCMPFLNLIFAILLLVNVSKNSNQFFKTLVYTILLVGLLRQVNLLDYLVQGL